MCGWMGVYECLCVCVWLRVHKISFPNSIFWPPSYAAIRCVLCLFVYVFCVCLCVIKCVVCFWSSSSLTSKIFWLPKCVAIKFQMRFVFVCVWFYVYLCVHARMCLCVWLRVCVKSSSTSTEGSVGRNIVLLSSVCVFFHVCVFVSVRWCSCVLGGFRGYEREEVSQWVCVCVRE